MHADREDHTIPGVVYVDVALGEQIRVVGELGASPRDRIGCIRGNTWTVLELVCKLVGEAACPLVLHQWNEVERGAVAVDALKEVVLILCIYIYIRYLIIFVNT